jgi:sec-independent protein translocase protein TatA
MYMNTILVGILGSLGTQEIILIALVVLIFFGGRKIPELMRGIGKGVKSFKDGMKGVDEEIKEPDKTTSGDEKDKSPQG